MLNLEIEQKIVEIGNVKLGGQLGENPIVMIGTVFYANHAALLDEKTGSIDKKLTEQELSEYTEIIEETQLQGIIDVVGSYHLLLIQSNIHS
jgi:tetrahydromethanopterin S-methyltransferase subunit H